MTQSGMARIWGNQQQSPGELFDDLPHEPSKEERFEQFVRENPEFVRRVIQRALAEKSAGMVRGGMKQYFEDFRKDPSIVFHGKYRLNNDFTSFMSRYVMDRVPELCGFFETRNLWDTTRKVPVKR